MTPRRSTPPLWFQVCVAAALAVVCRLADAHLAAGPAGDGHAPPVMVAFWPAIILIGSLIWKGIEVAGRVSLAVLQWVVANLSLVVTKALNALKDVGFGLLTGLKKTWDFFKLTYDRVLKPAVLKFWRWFDKARKWLDDTFAPLLRHLKDLRDALLNFWKTWVRPWLDLIDVTRKALRVLSSLGLTWARALDAKLGALEDKIEKPFRLLLAKVNEVINIVNRIVTADGLFQRAALIRSLGRDYQQAWRAIAAPYTRAVTNGDRDDATTKLGIKPIAQIESETKQYIRDGSGPRAALLDEMTVIWRKQLHES